MSDFFADQGKIAGLALLLSFLSIMVGLLIVLLQGKMQGLSAAFRGVEGLHTSASGLSTLAQAGLPMLLLQIIGFGLLTAMLQSKGESSVATIAFGLLIFAFAFQVLKGSFEGDMTVWAARHWQQSGQVSDMYEALHTWINNASRPGYVALIVAMALFGWGVLRADLLAPWVAWSSIVWSLLWLLAYLLNFGLPIVVVLYPLIFGLGLVLY